MKKRPLIFITVLALTITSYSAVGYGKGGHAYGTGKNVLPTELHAEQKGMHQHMQNMHDMMSQMQSTENPDARKNLMDEHRQAMEKGLHMMKMMMENKHQSNRECIKAENFDKDGQSCHEEFNHGDMKMNMMLQMMEHMMQRQRMME